MMHSHDLEVLINGEIITSLLHPIVMIDHNVTSQGESVPNKMNNQYSCANTKGDMSSFMKNSENFISD